MIITKDNSFKPVIITLESAEEVLWMKEAAEKSIGMDSWNEIRRYGKTAFTTSKEDKFYSQIIGTLED